MHGGAFWRIYLSGHGILRVDSGVHVFVWFIWMKKRIEHGWVKRLAGFVGGVIWLVLGPAGG